MKGDTTIIYAPAPPPGTTTYIALAADPLDGDLTKSFGELWTGFANAYQILQGGQATPLHTERGTMPFTPTRSPAIEMASYGPST